MWHCSPMARGCSRSEELGLEDVVAERSVSTCRSGRRSECLKAKCPKLAKCEQEPLAALQPE
jgi:hypothetical protein